ncbi:MAG: amino acid permease C-terminal domain-containing protein [Woeseiaceae bacterium]
MLRLPAVTWTRFAIWLVIGMCSTFYGFRHSVLGRR